MAHLISSGESSEGIILENDSMTVLDGGIANNITVTNFGYLIVFSGGTVDSTSVNSRSYLYVSSGGTANNTVLNGGCYFFIEGDCIVNSTTVKWSDRMYLSSGGTACDTSINELGYFHLLSGGTASNTMLSSRAFLYVSSGGIADGITINPGGYLSVESGGTALGISAVSGAVYSFAVVSNTHIAGQFDGSTFEIKDATISDFVVNSGGFLDVSSGGKATGIVINNGGSMSVSVGGVATDITENGGYVELEEGANATFVANSFAGLFLASNRSATVHSGTTATNTAIGYGGIMRVSSGGTANGIDIDGSDCYDYGYRYGRLDIASGGEANSAVVRRHGSMNVSSGGTANSTTVYYGGSMYVSAGGTATEISAFAGARLGFAVAKDTSISGTYDSCAFKIEDGLTSDYIVYESGCLSVSSGGTASNTTVRGLGSMTVFSSGFVRGAGITPGGTAYISSGGTADDVTVNAGGLLCVYSGGTATDIVWTPCEGSVFVSDGGYATFASQYSGIYYGRTDQLISTFESADGFTIESYYQMHVMNSGAANNITISSDGNLYVSDGGIADGVSASGTISVHSGGTVRNALLDRPGKMIVYSGGIADNTTVNGSLNVSAGGLAINTTANDSIYLYSGGVASNTTLYSIVYVNAASAYSNTINLYGHLDVFSNGLAENTVVNSGGRLDVASGGTANHVEIKSGGSLLFGYGGVDRFNAASATDVSADYGAVLSLTFTPDTYLAGKQDGSAFEFKNGRGSDFAINRLCRLFVADGAIADNIEVNSGGYLHLESGGTANGAVVNLNGCVFVSSGGTVNDITICSSGAVYVSSGGTANNPTVNFGGRLNVRSGGTATISFNPWQGTINSDEGAEITCLERDANVYCGGSAGLVLKADIMDAMSLNSGFSAIVYSGGTADGTTVNALGYLHVSSGGRTDDTAILGNGRMFVSNGGVAENTNILGFYGSLTVISGGTANSTTVDSYGCLYVSSGGTAENTTVNTSGYFYVYSGGVADETTVNSGGNLYVSSGGRLTGRISLSSGANAYFYTGGELEFDISELAPSPEAAALVSDLSLVTGYPTYALTVSAEQATGIYLLAGGASGFNGTITVRNTAGETLGTLTAGGLLGYGENRYTLNLTDGALTLTVSERDKIAPVVSNIQASTTEPTNKPVTVTADFADNKDELAATLYRLGETGEWTDYADGVTLYHNAAVYFKATDLDGNESEIAGCTVSNIENITGLVVSSGMDISVLEGDVFLDTAVMAEGIFSVSGGTAGNTTVDAGGTLNVTGGTASGITAAAGAVLSFDVAPGIYIAGTADGAVFEIADGLASGLTLGSGFTLNVRDGAAESITVNEGGVLNLVSFRMAYDTTVNEGGILNIASGEADGVTVHSGGYMTLDGIDAYAYDVTLEEGGSLEVYNGGWVKNLTADSGTYLDITVTSSTYVAGTSGGSAFEIKNGYVRDFTFDGGNLMLRSGCRADGATVENGTIRILRYGSAEQTTVNKGGTLWVSSGGLANSATINSGGRLLIMYSCTVNNITVNEGGQVSATAQTTIVNGATVNLGGRLHLAGSATGIVENGGLVVCGSNAYVSFASNTFSGLLISGSTATVHSGTTAAGNTVFGGKGYLDVYDGGITTSTTINSGGRINVFSGGTADNTTVSNGVFNISAGGRANDTTVNRGGRVMILSGKLTGLTVNSGGIVSATSGRISGLTVNSGGSVSAIGDSISGLAVNSGGIVSAAGGIISGLAVNAGGSMQFKNGTLTGRVTLADNGSLSMKDSFLNFDISSLAPNADALVGTFSLISGNPTCTLTFSDLHQQTGTYLLASGVETFDKPISVISNFGDQLGVLSVGGTLTTEKGMVMSLALADGLLTMDVNSDDVIGSVYANPNYTADITGTVMPNGDVLAFGVNAFADLDLAVSAVLEGGDIFISGFDFKSKDVSIQKHVNLHLSEVSSYGNLFVEPTLSSSTVLNGGISATIDQTSLNKNCYPVCRTGIINGNIDVLITNSVIGSPVGNYYEPTMLVLASNCSFGQDAESVSLTIRNSTVISDINMLSLSSAGTEDKPLSVTMTLDHVSMVEDKWFYLFGARNENRTLYADVTFNLSNSVLGSSGQRRTSIAPFYPTGSSTLVGNVTFNVKNLSLYGELAAVACSMDYGAPNAAIRGTATLNVTGGTTSATRTRGFDVVNIASGAVLQVDGLAARKVYADGILLTGSVAAEEVHLRHGAITNLIIESGTVFVSSGVVLNSARTAGINSAFVGIVVSSGGTAISATMMNGGNFTVSSGGTASFTRFDRGGNFYVLSGAKANYANVGSDGSIYISNGGTANFVSTYRAYATVSSGGTANNTFVSSGAMTVFSGGMAGNTEIRYASMFLYGGTADKTTIMGGLIDIFGGTANSTTVNAGTIHVSSGGTANSTTVISGSMYVSEGGTAADLLIDSRARVTVLSGGKLTGRITAGVISAYRGAVIDFDLTRTLPGAGALIYAFDRLSGNPDYTLTVNADQAEGIYALAGWASGFKVPITVVNTAGTTLGTLTVGSTLSISDVAYTLNLSEDGMLSLTVGNNSTPSIYTSDGAVIVDETSVLSGETFHDTVIGSGGYLRISSGGRTENTTIFGKGRMNVCYGGVAENTNILNSNGLLTVSSGGIARNLSVASGGSADILGTLTGQISLTSGARVYVDGYLDFDISDLTPDAPVLVNNLSLISGSRYSITVSGSQQTGTYKLAEGMDKFKIGTSFYVRDTLGKDLGKLSVGKALKVDGMYYLMNVAGDTLTVTYSEHPVFSGTLLGRNSNGSSSYQSAAYVSSGWIFEETVVYSNGKFNVSRGGIADSTTVHSRGSMYVMGGGTATNIEVNSGGGVEIREDSFVDGATVNAGGSMTIAVGKSGSVTNIVENGGYVEDKGKQGVIYASHTIDGLVLGSRGSATVHSGTTANMVQLNSYGSLQVFSGGIVNGAIVNSMGSMFLSSGATANSVTVNFRGRLRVEKGVAASMVTVNSDGSFYVLGQGSANGVTVASGGRMYVSAGGTATDIDAASGAYLTMAVTQSTFVTWTSGGSAFEIADGVLSGYTVGSGYLRVCEDGAVERISVVSGGSMMVEAGGTAADIAVNDCAYLAYYIDSATRIAGTSGGSAFEIADGVVSGYALGHELYLLSGAAASGITVNAGGFFQVCADGIADHTTVAADGSLYVEAGGTATNIVWTPCEGRITVEEGGYATFADRYSGVYYGSAGQMISSAASMGAMAIGSEEQMFVMDGGSADNIIVDADGEMTVSDGGAANGTTVNNYGYLHVSSGGAANGVTVDNDGFLSVFKGGSAAGITENGGYVYVSDDAEAAFVANTFSGLELTSATLHSGTTANGNTLVGYGRLEIYSGGTADNTVMSGYYGSIFVYSGGTADNTVMSGYYGSIFVYSGGAASNATVNGGWFAIESGGTADGVTVNADGWFTVESGGTANGTTVNSYGYLRVSSGGTANGTTVNSGGYLYVFSGGTANGTTVNSGGPLYVSSGGRLTGRMSFEAGAIVSAYSGSILDFDISGLAPSPESTALVSGLRFVYGAPNYTLTVSAAQEYGTYLLVTGATSFNELTVLDILGERLGTLRVGGVLFFGDYSCRLSLTDETLSLTLRERDFVAPTVSNIRVSTTEPTNLPVVVTADFSDNNDELASALYRIGETGEWTAYVDGVTLYRNEDVFFKAVDLDGNESEIAGCTVANIGTITGLVVSSGMGVSVPDGETFLDTVIVDAGSFWVESGGTASNATVNGGWFAIESGGTADGVTVNADGWFTVESGGTATNIVWTPCEGIVEVESGGSATFVSEYSGVYYGSAGHLLSSAAAMSSMTLAEEEIMYAMTGGTASEIMLDSLGTLHVSSGGTASGITVNDAGELYVANGGIASGIEVNDYGDLLVFAGAAVDDITLLEGSWILIDRGTATNITADAGVNWRLVISPETFITGTIFDDTEFEVKDGLISGFSVDYGCEVEIVSGGTANKIAVRNEGSLVIYDGGIANSTTVSDDAWFILSGGTANNTAVNSYGNLVVSSGGAANNTAVNGYNGRAQACAGGIASGTTVWDAGSLIVLNDGIADDTTVNEGGYLNIISGGTANNTAVNFDGTLNIISGGIANNTAIGSGGYLNISSGAIGNNTTVNSGWVWIDDGGAANNTTVNSMGELYVRSGGKQTGRMVFEDGAIVLFSKGGILDFDISLLAPETSPALLNNLSLVDGIPTFTLTVSNVQESGTYLLADGATDFEGSITVINTAGEKLGVLSTGNSFVTNDKMKYTLNLTGAMLSVTIAPPGSDITPQTQTWEEAEETAHYIVEYSTDNFEHVIQLVADSNSLDSFQMPAGNYQMRVKADGSDEWTVAAPVVAEETNDEPKLIRSNADGHADVFFVNPVGTWESGYVAQHVGSKDDKTWEGTKEFVTLFGKNKLTDIIEGSTDANVLLMSDDANGDALFVDDIYSASPDELGLSQSRIAQIDEIRAGAGNDIVDMTSNRFEYTGDGLTIRGGEGNDTIWANKGDNFLFGDAGKDRIVGASGNDVIAGGIGNDRMHGGGGNDIFTFCDNWGIDEVEQLAGGSVTLWFTSEMEGKVAWDDVSKSYTDGVNHVSVKGVTSVELKFGDDGSSQYASLVSAGAFAEFTSQKIFEESNGLLASQ